MATKQTQGRRSSSIDSGEPVLFAGDSEKWLLSCLVQRPEWFPRCEILEADDITTELYKPLFNCMLAENSGLDVLSLHAKVVPPLQPEYLAEVSDLEDSKIHLSDELLRFHIERLLEATFHREHRAAGRSIKRQKIALERYEKRRETAQSRETKLRAILAECRFNPDIVVPEAPAIYRLGTTTICTPSNLTTLTAQAKTGKSATIGAMIAAVFSDKGDTFTFSSTNPHKCAVVHIDTEQSLEHHWDNMRRAMRRAQVDKMPAWFYSEHLFSKSPREIMELLKQQLKDAKAECGGIHSALIDGVADCCSNVNDPDESSLLVTEFAALATEYQCPIVLVIHLNPPSGKDKDGITKSRGHLGSNLVRKSESNLIIKRTDEISVIYADQNRGAPIPEAAGPRFAWSNEHGMHVSCGTKMDAREQDKLEQFRDELQSVFDGKPAMWWKDCHGAIKEALECTRSTADRRFKAYKAHKLIRKTVTGQWERIP